MKVMKHNSPYRVCRTVHTVSLHLYKLIYPKQYPKVCLCVLFTYYRFSGKHTRPLEVHFGGTLQKEDSAKNPKIHFRKSQVDSITEKQSAFTRGC